MNEFLIDKQAIDNGRAQGGKGGIAETNVND